MDDDLPYQYRVQVGDKLVDRGCNSCKYASKVGELPEHWDCVNDPKSTGLCSLSDAILFITTKPNWHGAYQGSQCPNWKPK